VEAYLAQLGIRTLSLRSVHTAADRQATLDKFNNPSEGVDVLVSTFNLCALGVNMHGHCWTIVMFSLPYNLSTITQTIGRVYRMGQKRNAEIYIVTVDGTYDQITQSVIAKKMMPQLAGEASFPEDCRLPVDIQAERLIAEMLGQSDSRLFWGSSQLAEKDKHRRKGLATEILEPVTPVRAARKKPAPKSASEVDAELDDDEGELPDCSPQELSLTCLSEMAQEDSDAGCDTENPSEDGSDGGGDSDYEDKENHQSEEEHYEGSPLNPETPESGISGDGEGRLSDCSQQAPKLTCWPGMQVAQPEPSEESPMEDIVNHASANSEGADRAPLLEVQTPPSEHSQEDSTLSSLSTPRRSPSPTEDATQPATPQNPTKKYIVTFKLPSSNAPAKRDASVAGLDNDAGDSGGSGRSRRQKTNVGNYYDAHPLDNDIPPSPTNKPAKRKGSGKKGRGRSKN
jgi:hypothetical protein